MLHYLEQAMQAHGHVAGKVTVHAVWVKPRRGWVQGCGKEDVEEDKGSDSSVEDCVGSQVGDKPAIDHEER